MAAVFTAGRFGCMESELSTRIASEMGRRSWVKTSELLGDAVLEDLEIAGGQAGDVVVAAVGDRHIQVDDVHGRRKRRKGPVGVSFRPCATRRRR